MDKKQKVFTKPNEIRIKLRIDSLAKNYRRATFYFGHKVISKFFTNKELKDGARVVVSVINTSILIEKAKREEGIKLYLQGRGTLGIYKFQTSLRGELINQLPDLKVKDFEITKVMHKNRMIRVNLDCSELDAKTIKQAITKTDKDVKLLTKRELAPKGAEIRLKINEYKKTFRLYFTKETYNNFILENGIPGRVTFIFVPATPNSNSVISMVRVDSQNPLKGNKVVKVASYTVQGVIPSNFDITGINTENHVVRYKHIVENDTSFIDIYPEFKDSTIVKNNDDIQLSTLEPLQITRVVVNEKDEVARKHIEVLYKKIEQLESDNNLIDSKTLRKQHEYLFKMLDVLDGSFANFTIRLDKLELGLNKEHLVNEVLRKLENKIIQTTRSDAVNLNEEIDKITQEHCMINNKIRIVNDLLQKVSSNLKENQKQESRSFLKALKRFFS